MLLFIDHKYRYVLEGELPGVNLRTGSSRFRCYEGPMPLLLRKWFRAKGAWEKYLSPISECLFVRKRDGIEYTKIYLYTRRSVFSYYQRFSEG